jgi:glycosyltransferase involved in cell wall biosynthesis
LLLLEQFFYPEGWGGAELPRDIAVHFARSRCQVEVLCGSEQYGDIAGEPGRDPRSEGVTITRVPPMPGGRRGRGQSFLRQLWFCLWSVPRLFLRRPPDVFMSQTNPPLAVPLMAAAARLWRKPYVLIAMDVYPEVAIAHGQLSPGSLLSLVTGALFSWAYRSAARVVALGPIMVERLRAKGVARDRLVEISNWSTGKVGVVRGEGNRLAADLGVQGAFVLLYSGNLGLGHEFETLMRGFALASRSNPEFRLVFVGKGRRLDEVRKLADELGLAPVVKFLSFVPLSRMPESLGMADMGVVTLQDGFEGLVVPSKVYSYLSRGLPVLYIGPRSDVGLMVSRCDCGFVIPSGDVEGVARVIAAAAGDRESLRVMGEAGRAAYERVFARERALQRYERVVQECIVVGRGAAVP